MKKIIYLSLIFSSVLFSCKKDETSPESSNTSATTTTTTCDTSLVFNLELNNNLTDASCSPQSITNYGTSFTADRNNVSGKSLNFDGLSYLAYPSSNTLQPQLPFSVSFWVNVNDSSDWAHNYLMQSNARPNGGYCGYLIRFSGNGAIHFTVGDTTNNTTIDAISSVILNSKKWTHYTAVVKGNNNVDVYIDGVKDNSATVSGLATKITYPIANSVNQAGLIGGVKFSSNNGRLIGKMDKIKIWKKALNSSEVLSEYNNTN